MTSKRVLFALVLFVLPAPFAAAQEEPAPEAPDAAKAERKAHIARLKVALDGTEDPYPSVPFAPAKLNYLGFLEKVDRIADDPSCDAVQLELKGYGIGFARLLEVRDALVRLKRAGKKIFVYKEVFTTPDLVLASVADRISVPASGMVVLPGIATEIWYMRELLAKLRIEMDVVHIGAYKTAGESLVRDSMSKEMKESMAPVLDEFYGSIVDAIAEGRGLTPDAVRKAIDQALMTPKQAKEMGLVDRIEYEDQFKDGIRAHFPDHNLMVWKDPEEEKRPKIDPNNPMAVFSMVMAAMMGRKERLPEGPKVAVVYCTGPITSGKSQYDWFGNIASMGSETIVKAIDEARENDDVKAIVLRVNSPGGSGTASDMIWRAVERAKEKKPVLASMGDVAASGGYWISMNANRILAEPQTITGSIGVVGVVPDVEGLFAWVGIHPQRLSRGKRAEALMTTKALDDDGREMLRSLMQDFYGDFVAKVAAGRGKTPAEIEPIARGRIWTGRAALDNGLVDRLGGLEDAIALAREMGGIEGAKVGEDFHVLELPKRGGPFDALQEMFGGGESARAAEALGFDAAVLQRVPALRRILAHVRALQSVARDRVCAMNPELAGLLQPFAAAGR